MYLNIMNVLMDIMLNLNHFYHALLLITIEPLLPRLNLATRLYDFLIQNAILYSQMNVIYYFRFYYRTHYYK